jgi:hypothetical protein
MQSMLSKKNSFLIYSSISLKKLPILDPKRNLFYFQVLQFTPNMASFEMFLL